MHKPSIFYIILAGVLWGTAGIFSRVLGSFGFTPMQMTAMRNAVAAIVLCLYVLIKSPKQFKVSFKEIALFFTSGICIFFTGSLYYSAMVLTTPSTAVVLMYIAPIIVMTVSVIFLGEKFTLKKTISVVLAFVGCGLVTGIIGGMKFSVVGIAVGAMSGVCYAAYNICAKIEMKRGNDAVIASAYCFIGAAVVGLLLCNPIDLFINLKGNITHALPAMILQGIITGAAPYFLYTLASKRLPAGIASAMSSVEPMTATLISVILFKESLAFQSIIGIIFILSSVILLSRSKEAQ